jgi:hypothetical protein
MRKFVSPVKRTKEAGPVEGVRAVLLVVASEIVGVRPHADLEVVRAAGESELVGIERSERAGPRRDGNAEALDAELRHHPAVGEAVVHDGGITYLDGGTPARGPQIVQLDRAVQPVPALVEHRHERAVHELDVLREPNGSDRVGGSARSQIAHAVEAEVRLRALTAAEGFAFEQQVAGARTARHRPIPSQQ